jgi:HYDIN/CFA65/VesB family protein
MDAFTITAAVTGARLDVARRGQVDFTVTNTADRDLAARACVVTDGGADAGWFTVAEPGRETALGSTHRFGVAVAVPPVVAAGTYRFRLDVVDAQDPDEYQAEGPWTSLAVPALPGSRPIWPWLLAGAAMVLLVGLVVYLVFLRPPVPPRLSVTATVQGFGTVPVGQGSAGSVVTIANTGGAAATVSAVLGGPDPRDFRILANTCAQAVPAGSSCQLQVAFQPTNAGARSATLVVRTQVRAHAPPPLTLTGSGLGGATVTFLPASVVIKGYGPGLGVTVLTIRNTGGGNLRILGTKLDDPSSAFRVVSSCEGVTLAPRQSCDVAVLFTYQAAVPRPLTARLLVSDDQPGSPHIVPLSGYR